MEKQGTKGTMTSDMERWESNGKIEGLKMREYDIKQWKKNGKGGENDGEKQWKKGGTLT